MCCLQLLLGFFDLGSEDEGWYGHLALVAKLEGFKYNGAALPILENASLLPHLTLTLTLTPNPTQLPLFP